MFEHTWVSVAKQLIYYLAYGLFLEHCYSIHSLYESSILDVRLVVCLACVALISPCLMLGREGAKRAKATVKRREPLPGLRDQV